MNKKEKKSRVQSGIVLMPMVLCILFLNSGMSISNKTKGVPVKFNTISIAPTYSQDTSHASLDGPHIFYKGDTTIIKQVLKKKGKPYAKMDTLFTSPKGMKITCYVNDSIQFSTKIKSSLKNEKPTYPAPEKLIALSDIEGNFMQLRKFLIGNGVMNTGYQWTFGKGHLVLVGDFFDRGLNVTECLWLIYHLEQEALKSEGYVHFILGNHEIMNMNEDVRYVRTKYIENTYLIKEGYNKWFTPNTELGRWLQTKNIAEKVGNYLFMHGGMSKEMFACDFTLQKLNDEARKYYYKADEAETCKDICLATIYSGTLSPFWYRGFFDLTMDEKLLDTIVRHYGVSRIVVGHTLMDDVTYFYNKKVIAIDTHHAKGDSEGLLVEAGKEFRIDDAGNRAPIQ